MKIDYYSFGNIIIDGKSYSSDVIILKDKVISGWWRKEGHALYLEDLKDIPFVAPPHPSTGSGGEGSGEGENLEVLIIGTGASGMMMVAKEVRDYFKSKGVRIIEERTDGACEIYNSLCDSKRVFAVLHLTC